MGRLGQHVRAVGADVVEVGAQVERRDHREQRVAYHRLERVAVVAEPAQVQRADRGAAGEPLAERIDPTRDERQGIDEAARPGRLADAQAELVVPLVLVGGEQDFRPRGELVAGVLVFAAGRGALQLDKLAARVAALLQLPRERQPRAIVFEAGADGRHLLVGEPRQRRRV